MTVVLAGLDRALVLTDDASSSVATSCKGQTSSVGTLLYRHKSTHRGGTFMSVSPPMTRITYQYNHNGGGVSASGS